MGGRGDSERAGLVKREVVWCHIKDEITAEVGIVFRAGRGYVSRVTWGDYGTVRLPSEPLPEVANPRAVPGACRAGHFQSSTPAATKLISSAVPSALRASFAPSSARWSASSLLRILTLNSPSATNFRRSESLGTKNL